MRASPTFAATEPSQLSGEEDFRPSIDPETGIDLSLISENLKLTPWERILANDDTINFIDMARSALGRSHAAS